MQCRLDLIEKLAQSVNDHDQLYIRMKKIFHRKAGESGRFSCVAWTEVSRGSERLVGVGPTVGRIVSSRIHRERRRGGGEDVGAVQMFSKVDRGIN